MLSTAMPGKKLFHRIEKWGIRPKEDICKSCILVESYTGFAIKTDIIPDYNVRTRWLAVPLMFLFLHSILMTTEEHV